MTSQQLAFEESVADATGEDLCTIASRGFQPCEISLDELDPYEDRPPQTVDWDRVQGGYGRSLTPPTRRSMAA